MAQFARPDSNVTQLDFTNGFAEIDESSPSDADFAFGTNNTAAELEVGLGNVTDPASSSGHTFRYRIAKTNAGTVDGTGNAVTVTARLMQGTTQIATDTAKTADGTWTQYEFTLSGSEADAITDYTDLRLEFLTSNSGGAPANRRGGAVSWAELEVPDAILTVVVPLLGPDTNLLQAAVHLRIFANAFNAATSVFDPTISAAGADQNVVDPTFISATSVFSPATIQVVVTQLITNTTVFTPENIHLTVSVSLLASSTTTFSPSTTHHIAAELISSSTQAFAPTTTHTVIVPLLASATQLFIPGVVYVVVTPLINSQVTVFNPSTVHFVATPLISGTSTFEPVVQLEGGPITVVALFISGTSVFTPTVVAAQSIAMVLLSSSTTLFEPSTVAFVDTELIPSVSTLFNPALLQDLVVIAVAPGIGTALFAPTVDDGSVVIAPPATGPFELTPRKRLTQLRAGRSSGLVTPKRLGN